MFRTINWQAVVDSLYREIDRINDEYKPDAPEYVTRNSEARILLAIAHALQCGVHLR